MLKNYFSTALRHLWRNKVFSLINVIGLSIGLATCMLILLYVKDEVSFDRFHSQKDQIYRIVSQRLNPDGSVSGKGAYTGMVPGPAFKADIPEIADFVRVQSEQIAVKIGNEVFEQEGLYADASFFTLFSFPVRAGDPQTALSDPYKVVLSEDVAKKFFGTADALGKTLELPTGEDGAFETFTVSAITRRSPQNSSIQIQMMLPMKLNEREGRMDNQWLNFFLTTFVVLHPEANVQAVEQKMARVYEEKAKTQIEEDRRMYNTTEVIQYGLHPLLEMHLSTEYPASNGLTGASDPVYSYILSGIALFMLLIACINFVNLTVARSLKRSREIGIRKVVGGARGQLIFQFLGESMLLSLGAFLLALVWVQLSLPLFNELTNKILALSYLLDLKLVLIYTGLFLLTGLLAGFYPALVLSGFDPARTLYGRHTFTGKNYLSKGLVVLQFVLSIFMIVATLTIFTQFDYLTTYDLGYNDEHVVMVRTPRMDSQKTNLIKQELLRNPSIEKVGTRQGGFWMTIAQADGNEIEFAFDHIDHSYLSVFDIPMAQGRGFSPEFPGDSTESVLINEAFARKTGWTEPLGKKVDFFYNEKVYTVVGVVKDYHFASLGQEIVPQVLIFDPKYPYGELAIKIKPEKTSETLAFIEKTYKSMFLFTPYEHQFKDEVNRLQYESEAKWKQIISFSAFLTIFISCIGLFGLATLSAEKRTKEIGIRKVLGAQIPGIVVMLSSDFLKLVGLAALIAFPAAWWAMNRWLENYPYHIEIGLWIFAVAAFLSLSVSLLTVSFQAVRAAVANPVKSLKVE